MSKNPPAMKVTVLGCGTSSGVPRIAFGWGDCDPNEPRNLRMRASILIETNGLNIVVDTTPDFRMQMLKHNVEKLDAVIYTHAHGDHVHGIDDIRAFRMKQRQTINAYMDQETFDSLNGRFDYVFNNPSNSLYPPTLSAKIVKRTGSFNIENLKINTFAQNHGPIETIGLRIGDFAYSTDLVDLDEEAFEALLGVKVWVVDALQLKPHQTHAHLDKTLSWIERVKPHHAILTHMGTAMDYQSLKNTILQDHIEPAYDGMVLHL